MGYKYDGYGGENLYFGIQEPQPVVIGFCKYCKEAICEGETHYKDGVALIHEECLGEYIENEYSTAGLAEVLGMEKTK